MTSGKALSRAEEIGRRFSTVRAQTETLAEPLSAEDQAIQSMPDCSPTKWHRAHTSWFFETFLLLPSLPGYRAFHPQYGELFNSYYNSVGLQFPRPERGMISRPDVEEVGRYRDHVDRNMAQLLSSHPTERVLWLTDLGLNHEQQHQELLLTDIKHAFSKNPLCPAYSRISRSSGIDEVAPFGEPSDSADEVRFVGFEGGRVRIGWEEGGFSFDNEGPAHDVLLDDFELAARPLLNAEVLAFIREGGYENPLFWLSDGWAWLQSSKTRFPKYWIPEDAVDRPGLTRVWSQFTLHGKLDLDPLEVASHLSYFEADAIARFLGARLPTEQEWEHAARTQITLTDHSPEDCRLDVHRLLPGRAPAHTPGQLAPLFGCVWEWTQSPYVPYPGFSPPKGAVGEYNGKFMHNQMVLRGGSRLTPSGHLRVSYRNFFPSHTAFQFSGARLAQGVRK